MTKRQENERSLQTRIDQLQYEISQMRYGAAPVGTTHAPTPIERYVNPRSRVRKSWPSHLNKTI